MRVLERDRACIGVVWSWFSGPARLFVRFENNVVWAGIRHHNHESPACCRFAKAFQL
ncbi:hypothetical protein CERZMDRAFT_91142 [Cercospora zeae-maydis SCOH1-5]|uniref:Uncharacterized protein n=1 Tax=Cercospora zeae-maydis SCOH1-5 TaxID=717836 RepID=A0A6A6FA90_9PEZI|nr:hypothetical protein CERZMDRAFT_91142 [Cercospora zeae-maydis SCOH1-5]